MVFITLQIEYQQFEFMVELCTIEDIPSKVSRNVGNAFLFRSLEGGFDGFSDESLRGFFPESLLYGGFGWSSSNFDERVFEPMIDDCNIKNEALFPCFSALVEKVRPRLDENAFPAKSFFEIKGETVFDAVLGSDLDEFAAEVVEERQNLGFVRRRAEGSQRKKIMEADEWGRFLLCD